MGSKHSRSTTTGTWVATSKPFQFHGLRFRVAVTITELDGTTTCSYTYEVDWNRKTNKTADTFVSRGRVVSSSLAVVRLFEVANELATLLISKDIDVAQIGFIPDLSSRLAKTERIVDCEVIKALPTKDLKIKSRILIAR